MVSGKRGMWTSNVRYVNVIFTTSCATHLGNKANYIIIPLFTINNHLLLYLLYLLLVFVWDQPSKNIGFNL